MSACIHFLQTRDSTLSLSAAQIASFGLLRDGCLIEDGSFVLKEDGRGIFRHCVEYKSAVNSNGYFFSTLDSANAVKYDPSDADPVRWILLTSTDPLSTGSRAQLWESNNTFVSGASVWMMHPLSGLQVNFAFALEIMILYLITMQENVEDNCYSQSLT